MASKFRINKKYPALWEVVSHPLNDSNPLFCFELSGVKPGLPTALKLVRLTLNSRPIIVTIRETYAHELQELPFRRLLAKLEELAAANDQLGVKAVKTLTSADHQPRSWNQDYEATLRNIVNQHFENIPTAVVAKCRVITFGNGSHFETIVQGDSVLTGVKDQRSFGQYLATPTHRLCISQSGALKQNIIPLS